jgi:hypothetical protein
LADTLTSFSDTFEIISGKGVEEGVELINVGDGVDKFLKGCRCCLPSKVIGQI